MAGVGGQKAKRVPRPSAKEQAALDAPLLQDGEETKEAQQLGSGIPDDELRRQAANNEHRRSASFRDHFEWIALGLLWMGALAIVSIGFTVVWHWIAPSNWCWLNQEQIDRTQVVLTSGLLSSVVTAHLRRRIG